MSAGNLLTDWAALLLDAFAKAGVRDVVISPGSRSTPFVIAAARHPQLRCHDLLDERAAGFFALGQARVTGRPSLLLCTSGTAGAHYLPSVIEATSSYTPLLVLTADRPLELQDCAAAQTIDQVKIYGDHVRRFLTLGAPDPSPSALRLPRRLAAQAVLATRWPTPGAVHVNARARKPLDPCAPGSDEERALHDRIARMIEEPLVAVAPSRALPDAAAIADLARICRRSPRGLIVCGPAPIAQTGARDAILRFAALTRYPILAEATSQLRVDGELPAGVIRCDHFDGALRSREFREGARPDLIVQLGAPPTSGGWEIFLDFHAGCRRTVVAPHGWNDPQNSATAMLFGEVGDVVRDLCAAIAPGATLDDRERLAWARHFAVAGEQVGRIVDAELAATPFTEGGVARAVVAGLPARALFVAGNSLAIRLVDGYARDFPSDAQVIAQRGANGIDGLLAGAIGAAATGNRPVTLLIGDISLLHDLNSLALARDLAVPLVVVVLQNGGGRLFEQLPLASTEGVTAGDLAHLITPHPYQLEHAAQLFGHRYRRVDSPSLLGDALAEAHRSDGCTVIEAILPAHGAAEQQRRLSAALDALPSLIAQAAPLP